LLSGLINGVNDRMKFREQWQCVLTLDVRGLVKAHTDRILLTHMNTGATRPFAHERGADTFCTIRHGDAHEEKDSSLSVPQLSTS